MRRDLTVEKVGARVGCCNDGDGRSWSFVPILNFCLLCTTEGTGIPNISARNNVFLFIAAFALESGSQHYSTTDNVLMVCHASGLSISGVISPITADLAAVSRKYDGLGCEYHSNERDVRALISM